MKGKLKRLVKQPGRIKSTKVGRQIWQSSNDHKQANKIIRNKKVTMRVIRREKKELQTGKSSL